MALTLVEASKLSNDVLLQGVAEDLTNESEILRWLPWMAIVGNGLTYNREDTPPAAAFFDVGDNWAESTPTFAQATATLRIMGGDADIDNFLRTTRSNINDLEAEVLRLKVRAVANLFDDTVINGDEGLDPNSFDGLDQRVTGGQTVSMGTDGAVLDENSLDKLDEMIDKGRGPGFDLLIMSRRSRRSLNKVARDTGGSFLSTDRDDFGRWVQRYNDLPIAITDYISDSQTVGTSNDTSTIYGVQFGPGGVMGLHAGELPFQVENIGSLEVKDATRHRVKGYVSLANFTTFSIARLIGVRAA